MRVVSGLYKGKNITIPEGNTTRPTGARAKEGIFSALGDIVEDCRLFEPFCGSAQISIEALSRGAEFALGCEIDKKAYAAIKKNIDLIGVKDFTLLNSDYKKALNKIKEYAPFNLFFLDPPYNAGKNNQCLEAIEFILKNNLASENAVFVCEISSFDTLPGKFLDLTLKKEYKYSAAKVYIYHCVKGGK